MNPATRFRFVLFVSVLLHAALGWWLSRHPPFEAPGKSAPAPVIRVSLAHALPRPEPETPPRPERSEPPETEAERPPPQPAPMSRPARQPAPKPTAARPPAREATPSAETPPPPAATRTTSPTPPVREPAPAPAPPADPMLEAEYLAGLRAEIMRHHYYPRRARRRGEEGRVRVAFTLLADGRLSGIRVVAGSGSRALDRAALQSVRAVGRYRPIPPATGRTRWPLELDIDFRLRD